MPPPRKRRSSAEVRSLILDAAVEVFGEKGYAAATTREIAERAGVAGTLLFRNFGGKEGLFEAAVVEPIDAFLKDYTDGWLSAPLDSGDPDQMIRTFVEGLYDLAQENRQVLLAAAREHLGPSAQVALGRLERMAEAVAQINAYVYDPAVAVRAAVAMVVSMSLYEDELFPPRKPPGRERVVQEMTGILLRGLTRAR